MVINSSDKCVFSIIIPHRNCINLLKRCIDSIPARDDLEVIIIDDNSNIPHNEFPYINREYIRYIFLDSDESNYAGHARNEGLKVAKGKWLIFADADDYFTDSLNTMLDKYKDDDLHDIVYLCALVEDEDGNAKEYCMNSYIQDYSQNVYYSEKLMRYAIWTPWSRMVKKDLVEKHNIRFEECASGNDIRFGLLTSKYASNITYYKSCIYSYFRPSYGSITDTYYRIDTLENRMLQRMRINDFYSKVHFTFKLPILGLRRIPTSISKDKRKEYKTHFWALFTKHKLNIFTELYNAIKWKLATTLKIIKVI